MAFPAGYRTRPPRSEDIDTIVELANAESEALIGVPLVSADWLRSVWSAPATDLENDTVVVTTTEGEIAGYGFIESDPPHTSVMGVGFVALDHHGRGVGGSMVEELEQRAQRFVALAPADARVALHAATLADEPRVSELLSARGYTEVRRFSRMRIEFGAPPRPAEPPAGITLRSYAPGDETTVYACMTEAFKDHWGEGWPEFAEWTHQHITTDTGFDPEFWRLAWAGERLAGAALGTGNAEEDPAFGYIAELGVHPEFRGRGVGEAVLRSSFERFHAAGRTGTYLYVDTDSMTGADRLYARVGMTVEPRFATWERELRPAR